MVLFISAPRVCETYTARWKQTINIRRRASNSINKVKLNFFKKKKERERRRMWH
jgi:hypothetical protein